MKKDIVDQQLNEIFSLRSTIEEQKKEITHLKDLLYNAAPLISTDKMSDEEFIAINELKKLKQKSEQEILTFEEAKKVELYYKVIKEIRFPKEKNNEKAMKDLPTEELLAQLSLDEK